MKFGECSCGGSMTLTRGGFGISIQANPSQQMLSYLIAVEIENIIDTKVDFKNLNFDLNLLLKDMEVAPKELQDTRLTNDKYRYTIKIERSKIKIGTLTSKDAGHADVVSLPFEYTSE